MTGMLFVPFGDKKEIFGISEDVESQKVHSEIFHSTI